MNLNLNELYNFFQESMNEMRALSDEAEAQKQQALGVQQTTAKCSQIVKALFEKIVKPLKEAQEPEGEKEEVGTKEKMEWHATIDAKEEVTEKK